MQGDWMTHQETNLRPSQALPAAGGIAVEVRLVVGMMLDVGRVPSGQDDPASDRVPHRLSSSTSPPTPLIPIVSRALPAARFTHFTRPSIRSSDIFNANLFMTARTSYACPFYGL